MCMYILYYSNTLDKQTRFSVALIVIDMFVWLSMAMLSNHFEDLSLIIIYYNLLIHIHTNIKIQYSCLNLQPCHYKNYVLTGNKMVN